MPVNNDDFDRLYHTVFGNGNVGLDEIVRGNTRQLTELNLNVSNLVASQQETTRALAELRTERRLDAARLEGRIQTLNWLRWALIVGGLLVTLGGALGFDRLSEQFTVLQEQLRQIPQLPTD